jgi:hypothetical protein
MVLFLALLQMAQAPSPAAEPLRAHSRLEKRDVAGKRTALKLGTLREAEDCKPRHSAIVIHLHGEPWVVEQSVRAAMPKAAVLAIHLGAGSRVYAEPFRSPDSFARLLADTGCAWGEVYLTAFSAGYGGVREILRVKQNADRLDGVALLDGLHAGYAEPQQQRRPLDADLEPFAGYAGRAARGEKRMVITHSEIFPGSYASTTECADWLAARLGLRRRPVLAWGPHGMQQIGEAHSGGLHILSFAGNSAPDHVDHLHGLAQWLKLLK